MKVISLLQPWATLVVLGAKKIETRSFNTKYRGPLLIHASKGKNNAGRDLWEYNKHCFTVTGEKYNSYDILPFGTIIGQVNLVETVESFWLDSELEATTDVHKKFVDAGCGVLTDQERAFGDYSPGRFGWLFTDPVLFDTPIQAKGMLGLWNYELPDHFHMPLPQGGHATFSGIPSKETVAAVTEMAALAYTKLKTGSLPK